ncbi:hypothetical protein B9G55_10380 [Saccharibacillus sp. O16]|nr:hypothetical protein B9G55_10380 [Saccharibacillus sp. O16]
MFALSAVIIRIAGLNLHLITYGYMPCHSVDHQKHVIKGETIMQEEVTFRELIRVILRKKTLIIVFTILVMVATGIINFFAAPVLYSATSYVTAVSNAESTQQLNLNPFLSQVMSDTSLRNIAAKLKLDDKNANLNTLRERINLSYAQENSLITVQVKNKSAEIAQTLSNQLAYEMASEIEGTGLSLAIVKSRQDLNEVNVELAAANGETQKAKEELANSRPLLETNQSLLADGGLNSVLPGLNSETADRLNGLSLKSEEANPSYSDIEEVYVKAAVNLNKLTEQKKYLEQQIKQSQSQINEAKSKVFDINNPNVDLTLTQGAQAVTITPAATPDEAVSKGTVLKTLLAGILAFVLACMYVLFSHYWREPAKK